MNKKLIIFFNDEDSCTEMYGSENEESSDEDRPVFMKRGSELNSSAQSLGRIGDRYEIDQAEYDYVKLERKRLKLDLAKWTKDFKQKNGRMPDEKDQEEVKKDMDELNVHNKRYTEIKYILAKKSEKEN
eukprot:CAMPEP_0176402880 /NCGR_PEP_ID=MMETSP0126-20121128/49640_1 /TAXON_ID=141414 ORGANISM="Strombidinopsis acuminatum, Strain SPMC142" /NCGR_SAMPLE_ID=MMETSP0126 /ASSEMBLY_ACC=CAM_ASM_000229 /LENGTH=128 /DNA_ID=CAMNT_0017780779 /DNA_START=532 /DNA_END=918 /DNA_ORIENTATION=-